MRTHRGLITVMLVIVISLLIPSGASPAGHSSIGQSSFDRLAPGKSTKADVERALGRPLREWSETLAEYKSGKATERIFVQYRRDSEVIERIEVVYPIALERADVLRALNLPPQATASQTNAKGRLEEYFSPKNVVLTYAGAEASGGVSSVGYYSRELFESAVAEASGAREQAGTQTGSSRQGSGADTGLADAQLPEYMRPPAGGRSASVDRTGRVSTSGGKSSAPELDQTKQTTTTAESPDFVITRPDGGGKIRPVTPTGETGGETEIRLGSAELRRLVGRYQFTITSVPRLKQAVVTLTGETLRLASGPVSGVLVPIAWDDFTVGDQGESEILRFKLAGRPGVKVYFQILGGKIERLFMIEHERRPKRFSVAVPAP